MRYLLAVVALGIALMGYFLYSSHKETKLAPDFVGMQSCQSCHPLQHQSVIHTLHPTIFRPVTSQEQIVGDFSTENPLVTFKKEDIEFVVGSKWEQVYMRMIDGDQYPFPAKWMVTTQQWVPYKTHDWMETPASTKCNGCHTTGYSKDDHSFNEFGVKCEACHGPASHHVAHQKMNRSLECRICHQEHKEYTDDIIVSQKSSVCGQCHSRGQTTIIDKSGTKTLFNFPLEYLPGADLNSSFIQTTLQNDTKGKNWWGSGVSKNRHQEYADFSVSDHAKSLEHLHTKKNPHGTKKSDDCLRCHSQDYRSAKKGEKPTLESARLGLTCVTCHEPHGADRQIGTKRSLADRCSECHVGSKASSQEHTPCPSTEVGCVDCHMPYIIKSGGSYPIRSHAFKIIPPEASEKYQMPNSCQNGSCHQDQSLKWAMDAYDSFYRGSKYPTLAEQLKSSSP